MFCALCGGISILNTALIEHPLFSLVIVVSYVVYIGEADGEMELGYEV